MRECIAAGIADFEALGYRVNDIRAVGLTNQRETTVVWDRDTGEPLYNAIAWPDTRTQALVSTLKSRAGVDELRGICGLPLSTYPAAVKLLWLLENVDRVQEAYQRGRLAFGTVDTWLIYSLNGGTGGSPHVTDVTNASRTMFMRLDSLDYDDRLLGFFGLDRSKLHLPRIVPSSSSHEFGSIESGPLKGILLTGCLGDQSAALVGQRAFSVGSAKNTYGTGCFLLYNTGHKPVISQHGLLTTVGYQMQASQPAVYALEGSIAAAGSAVSFLAEDLGFAESAEEISELAASVPDSGGCVFVTAFSGLFAPYWIDDARGTIFGLTRHSKKAHIARAALEAACFQTRAILDAMEHDSGHRLAELAVDGGMSSSDVCMQVSGSHHGHVTRDVVFSPQTNQAYIVT